MSKPFIPRNQRRQQRPGVLSARRVRLVSFFAVGAGLFLTAVICVLAIWEYTSGDAAWRSVATLGVIASTLFLFTSLNEWFGVRIRETEPIEAPAPPTQFDPQEQNESPRKAES